VSDRTVDLMGNEFVGSPARPQPLGAFPLPAGYLLVPAGTGAEAAAVEDARRLLVEGRLPQEWPPSLDFLRLAHSGDIAGSLRLLGDAGDAVSRYNRYVLDPQSVDIAGVRDELGELGVMVDVVQYATGETDAPPPAADETAELRALVLATHASQAVDEGRTQEAITLLLEAAEAARESSPPLAGQLLATAATMRRSIDGPVQDVVLALVEADRLLAGSELAVGRAEVHLELGSAYQELAGDRRDLLTKAISHYHAALSLIDVESAPEIFASAQVNVAAAYLTMPMIEATDQLRLGVAVGCLRAALTVYHPETHPERWASTQLNLANALVYAPSTHQGDNLVEAVELYEAVLGTRDRHVDPLGLARVLANQGNALAHLGVFDQAKAKLYEARFIFEEFEDVDSVRAVRGVLDEISRQVALEGSEALAT
jgi:tetratricopeptide (TPR) repeat protein